jgi:hypothetical protein
MDVLFTLLKSGRERGGGGWMRGPCACPRPGELIQRVSRNPWRNRHSRGQAQGPLPSPHPPLVPTEPQNAGDARVPMGVITLFDWKNSSGSTTPTYKG